MDSKKRNIDVVLANCKGEYQFSVRTGFFSSKKSFWCDAPVSKMPTSCFITASLTKALKHSRRLDSDSSVFFDSVSLAVDAIQFNRVSLNL